MFVLFISKKEYYHVRFELVSLATDNADQSGFITQVLHLLKNCSASGDLALVVRLHTERAQLPLSHRHS